MDSFNRKNIIKITKIHKDTLRQIVDNSGSCKGIRCHDCPFTYSNNKRDICCGNIDGILSFKASMTDKDRQRIKLKAAIELLGGNTLDYKVIELEEKVCKLEDELRKIKMEPFDIVLEEIKNHKFTNIIDKSFMVYYNARYNVWSIQEHSNREIITLGDIEFTEIDANFIMALLNKYNIKKEHIKDINKILGGIKYE